METYIVIILYLLIIIFDFIPVVKKKCKREILFYSFSLVISFVVLFLTALKINIPFDIY